MKVKIMAKKLLLQWNLELVVSEIKSLNAMADHLDLYVYS
jgi:hypothetical protein